MSEAVARRLRDRIAVAGAIPVAVFMAEALAHPEHGYYMRRDPLGRAGDFTTAPEISQAFGELIGLWLVDCWRALGGPAPVALIELGPGRGTLLSDALRAARLAPDFLAAVQVHLVEPSPALAAIQRRTLAEIGLPLHWHVSLDTVPPGPLLLVANEVFDALPVHQFVFTEEGWRERLVTVDDFGAFHFCLARGASPLARLLPPELHDAPLGAVGELSAAAIALAGDIGRRVAADGGAALLIDYGAARSGPGDTLQAVRGHRCIGVLDDPGSSDLTVHVDFALLSRAGREAGAAVYGPVPQGEFLRRLGIEARAARLAQAADGRAASEVISGCRRLIAPEEMGTLFKALALTGPGRWRPAGFEELESQ